MLAERILVLGSHDATLGGLLDRQADTATLQIEIDDLDPQLFAGAHYLLRVIHVVNSHLGNVHQTLDAFADLHERSEWHQLGDTAVDQLPNPVGAGELRPRILLGGLQRQADALPLVVDLEDLHGDAITNGDHRRGVIDVLPRKLGHVHEAVHAAQVDERTEIDHAGHDALANLARLEVGQEVLALVLLGLFQPRPAAEHHVVAVLVEFDDLGLERFAHIGQQVAHTAQFHQRSRQEAAQADVDDETALDHLDDRTGYDAVVLLDLLDRTPCPLVLSTLLGQDQTSLFVLFGEDQRFDDFAQADDLGRVDVVANTQLTARDDALGLESDIEQDLVLVDLDDGTGDDVTIIEFHDGAIDGLVERHRSKVIGDDGAVYVLFDHRHRLVRVAYSGHFGGKGLHISHAGCGSFHVRRRTCPG